MITPLREAGAAEHGGKAATLSVLLREGLPVPDGFVVGARAARPDALRSAVAGELERLGAPVVAVRSSAANEDTDHASAAGQYESVLGVSGAAAVHDAIIACQASARSPQVIDYRNRTTGSTGGPSPDMAVLVQPLIDADVSGVMFTPGRAGGPTHIEASWGLGPAVVGGLVTPDRYEVAPDGTVRVGIGAKARRIDLNQDGAGLIDGATSAHLRAARTLSDQQARSLAALGSQVTDILGGLRDVEWAIADGQTWILQARPVTAPLPQRPSVTPIRSDAILTGSPGSPGVVTARARIVLGPSGFAHVQPGEILVCPFTEPAWTPLFAIAAGVITETGGALSHAAIVAREYGIPAAHGVAGVMQRIRDGDRITLDGAAGTVAPA